MAKKAADAVQTLDSVLANAEAEAAASRAAANAAIDATEKAREMARDFGVDLTKVKGTGHDKKITVPDVDAYIKKSTAEQESKAAEAAAVTQPPVVAGDGKGKSAKSPAGKKKAGREGGEVAAAATLALGLGARPVALNDIKHIVRTLGPYGMGGWEQQFVSYIDANENIGRMLDAGWQLIHVEFMGLAPDGIQIMWVLGKPAEQEAQPRYHEIMHIVRTVGTMGASPSVSGLQADALISSYFLEGWELAHMDSLGMTAEGIFIMWVLVR